MPRRIMPLMLAASVTAAAAAPGDAGLMDKARLLFEATAAATCDTDDNAGEPPQVHAIGFRYSYDAEEDPERTAPITRSTSIFLPTKTARSRRCISPSPIMMSTMPATATRR
jgi:hypothetical protein